MALAQTHLARSSENPTGHKALSQCYKTVLEIRHGKIQLPVTDRARLYNFAIFPSCMVNYKRENALLDWSPFLMVMILGGAWNTPSGGLSFQDNCEHTKNEA